MRLRFPCFLLLTTITTALPLAAQTAPGDGDLRRDVAALRDAVIQQTRQIDALTSEVERLGVALGQRRPSNTTASANSQPTVQTSQPSATAPAAALPVNASSPAAPPNTVEHTVTKGENLTTIAKKYGTTALIIQKLNKITDVKKLQVDQVLYIPMPTTPSPATASPSPAATPSVAAPTR